MVRGGGGKDGELGEEEVERVRIALKKILTMRIYAKHVTCRRDNCIIVCYYKALQYPKIHECLSVSLQCSHM